VTSAEHVDVLIIGAGLSGIGAAAHLAKDLPAGARRTAAPARDRSTGIAVRPSHGPGAAGTTRRAS
jgi:glycine/D-amino acid oxidase-like deaminating enzyme